MRHVLTACAIALITLLRLSAPNGTLTVDTPSPERQPDVMRMTVRTIAPRLHVIIGFTNGNMLAVDTDDGVLLVDAQSEKRVALADSALRTVTTRPVRFVVATHYHDDHIGGDAYWRTRGATVVAQANVLPRARRDTTISVLGQPWWHAAVPEDALPTRTFDDSLTLSLGNELVELLHIPSAHTDGDAIIRLPRRNVLHVGDIVEVGDAPFLDRWAGGSLDGMIRGVDRIAALCDERTIIVPGHGAMIDRTYLTRYRAALVATGALVRAAIDRHTDPGNGAALVPTEYLDLLGGVAHASRFARIVYDSIHEGAP
jgi:glyoxylase-like metal-dependent hydrolase (beta-lactamase superfamily II)